MDSDTKLTTDNKQFVGVAKIPASQSICLLKPKCPAIKMGGDNTRTVRVFSPYRPVYIFELFVCFDILLEAKSMSSVSNNHFLASLVKIFRFLNKISEI